MIELFLKGGPLMYPLLLGSIVSLAVIVERGLRYLGTRTPWSRIEAVQEAIAGGDFEGASERSRAIREPLASVIAEVIGNHRLPRQELESRISLAGSAQLKRLGQHLHLLELIGKIAPMIGLSGTVLGLARAFQEVAGVERFTDPSILASGIWEALITTVAGLFIGIPALIFFHLYENRLKSLAFEMKSCGEELLSSLGESL